MKDLLEQSTKKTTTRTSFDNVEKHQGNPEDFVDLIDNILYNMKQISEKEEYYKFYFENLEKTLDLKDVLKPIESSQHKLSSKFL